MMTSFAVKNPPIVTDMFLVDTTLRRDPPYVLWLLNAAYGLGKKGAIPKQVPFALSKTGCTAKHWPIQVKAVGSSYWRMIGTTQQLIEKAESLGQQWLKGIGIAKQLAKA